MTDKGLRWISWLCFLAAGLLLVLSGACEIGLLS